MTLLASYQVGDRVTGGWMGVSFTATIQHIDTNYNILIGWKVGEERLGDSWNVQESTQYARYLLPGYQYGYWITLTYITGVVGSALTPVSEGMKCARCGEFNPYAVPNQPDSTHKCYSCRQPH